MDGTLKITLDEALKELEGWDSKLKDDVVSPLVALLEQVQARGESVEAALLTECGPILVLNGIDEFASRGPLGDFRTKGFVLKPGAVPRADQFLNVWRVLQPLFGLNLRLKRSRG